VNLAVEIGQNGHWRSHLCRSFGTGWQMSTQGGDWMLTVLDQTTGQRPPVGFGQDHEDTLIAPAQAKHPDPPQHTHLP
jgi:hypothetical protein